ncbi:MAG: glycosyltransferase family 4 protein [Burkholderiaceae bacterium]
MSVAPKEPARINTQTAQPEALGKRPRLTIQQTALPAYRAPLFKAIAALPETQFKLVFGSEAPALKNVSPEGFAGEFAPFKRIDLPGIGTLIWHGAQWRLASGRESELLVLNANTRVISLLPAMLRARVNKLPIAIWGHGYSKSPAAWRNWLRRLPVALADAVLLYDPQTKHRLVDDGVDPSKIFVAANGLDRRAILAAQKPWRDDPSALDAFKAENGLNNGPVLIHLSRLLADNRLDIAIESLPHLSRAFPGIKLVVVGDGADERSRLERIATQAGVQEHIVWVGALYDEASLAPWMMSADLFVYPKNVGLSLIHGFNYGLPAALCGPLSEHNPEISAFSDGVNGCLAQHTNAASFAETVASKLGAPHQLDAMAKAAFLTAAEQFNVEKMAATFGELAQFLLTKRLASASGQ